MKKKKFKVIITIIIIVLIIPIISFAHGGKTDSSGGHRDNNNVSGLGSYHYHHGYSAHLHPNGVCPYETKNTVTYTQTETAEASISLDQITAARMRSLQNQVNTLENKLSDMEDNYNDTLEKLEDTRSKAKLGVTLTGIGSASVSYFFGKKKGRTEKKNDEFTLFNKKYIK